MNGFEGLFSIPVIGLAAWWLIQRMFKKYAEKIENSVDKKEFEKTKEDLWRERDKLRSDVDEIKGFLKGKNDKI